MHATAGKKMTQLLYNTCIFEALKARVVSFSMHIAAFHHLTAASTTILICIHYLSRSHAAEKSAAQMTAGQAKWQNTAGRTA